MAMKRQNEFAEGTSEDRARDQLADRIIGLFAAYRTRERQTILIARVPFHPLKKMPALRRDIVENQHPDSFALRFINGHSPFPCQAF